MQKFDKNKDGRIEMSEVRRLCLHSILHSDNSDTLRLMKTNSWHASLMQASCAWISPKLSSRMKLWATYLGRFIYKCSTTFWDWTPIHPKSSYHLFWHEEHPYETLTCPSLCHIHTTLLMKDGHSLGATSQFGIVWNVKISLKEWDCALKHEK